MVQGLNKRPYERRAACRNHTRGHPDPGERPGMWQGSA
ncbi:hypothetical protein ASZ90_015299 [hydrocarbon metagenome]|uniref:Uncharacterized protein n=1 Tax=hydrocarbon metagenome TaxID=938273 RepID=A0A0W8F3S6_9ZZZZ